MKIAYEFPPNIEEIRKIFPDLPHTVVFTYADTVYVPSGQYPDTYLQTHEETHQKQQGTEVDEWWNKYLNDPEFRLSQEIEAYQNQYRHYCRNKKDRFRQADFLDMIAEVLSGPMYGNLTSVEEARKKISEELVALPK